MKKLLFLLTLVFGFGLNAIAQDGQESLEPKPSPLDVTKAFVGDSYVKIVYSRPHKRDRDIFGGLVPFDKVWRTGANAATEITTTEDIKLNGNDLKAGTYSLFTIPGEDEWTIIINSEVGQWGAYRYKEENDVMRFTVPVEENDDEYEAFTIYLEGDSGTPRYTLMIMWDDVKVSFPVTQ